MKHIDTFNYLLEDSTERSFSACGKEYPYVSHKFDIVEYSKSRGINFSNFDEAYDDWLKVGRSLGLSYGIGKNTALKIVLKAANEPDLIERWISHHASIVGIGNLIIVDCGSTLKSYLDILDKYKEQLIILNYEPHYDFLHQIQRNLDFFKLLKNNCKYLAILDADEFLFMAKGDSLSSTCIVDELIKSDDIVFPCTWVNTVNAIDDHENEINWNSPRSLHIKEKDLIHGTYAGKAIIKSDSLLEIGILSHNLFFPDLLSRYKVESFGKFLIIHFKDLPLKVNKYRVLAILKNAGFPDDIIEDDQILQHLKKMIDENSFTMSNGTWYAQKYISLCESPIETFPDADIEKTLLLSGITSESLPKLTSQIAKIDFEKVLADAKLKHG